MKDNFKNKKVKLSELAEKSKVSLTTASQVINKVKDIRVSQDTRKRVLAVAEEIGYKTNIIARGLATGKTKIIALLMCGFFSHAFHYQIISELIRGIGYSLEERE